MTLSIARRADQWGDRRAVVDCSRGRTLTYADLADRIQDLAGKLAGIGVSPGDRVVVLSHNSVDYLASLFAARERGATLAPVSQRLAAETVTTLCDRIDPTLVIAEDEFADLLADVDADYRPFTALDDAEAIPDAAANSDVDPLFLHTGGTTGVPKVVPISEHQLEWNAITESVAWGLDDETVTVTVLPFFHTGGWNLLTLPTLYAGGTVVLQPEFGPGRTLDAIETYGATQLFAVAAIYRALAEHPAFDSTDLSSLDWVMSGGGPCPEAVMEPYRERDVPFVQGYGLTEGGPNNLYLSPDRADIEEKSDRVGRPFPDCEARIVDSDGTPIEGEGTGELELAGPVTAGGYLHTEDGTFDGGRWVSTGDVARRDADGDYAIVGRTDNMFVSGGENVYPEDIEDTLSNHPDVAAVGITPVADEEWGEVPKAVVVGDVSEATLDAYARDHLAAFEVPKAYAFVAELPETGAGKLDRDALRREYGR
ncbi:class I adenylate-forming enzyme family protein [Salinibaculum salinum]|uniref:class I adenylate-forming enzyme family protein n=1 Tax=Salinibaculum salinum TaxID=3131996 RepID=UPI0030EF72A5